MKSHNYGHLREEQIVWAVIDKKELSNEDYIHLMECRLCQGKVEQFTTELQVFGEKAKLTVPTLKKSITMPRPEPEAEKLKSNWLPFFGAAAMAGLVLFFYFIGMENMSPKLTNLQSPENLLEDEYLMQEISEMVEHSLPDELYEITGDTDGFDDEFLQFVVPEALEDYQS